MPKILVTRRTFPEAAEAMRASGAEVVIWEGEDSPSQQDLIAAVADIDGLYAHITNQVDAEVMAAAPKLKVIAEFGVGYDNIDIKAANERGIAVGNTPGILSESTADEAFALLASMARRTHDLPAMVKRGSTGESCGIISLHSCMFCCVASYHYTAACFVSNQGAEGQQTPPDFRSR